MKMAESFPHGWKIPREKEKLLIMNVFSFAAAFSKELYCRHVKAMACLGKVKAFEENTIDVTIKLELFWQG